MPGDKCGSPDRLGKTSGGDAPRQRVLTGDRPTGPLHLGHYVGTLANRVRLQREHDLFVLVADYHLLTTRLDRRDELAQAIREDVLGNLAVGLDPGQATIYLQSQVPEVAELFLYLAMLVSVPRVRRIPTLKDKLRDLSTAQPSYGLLGYPVLQAADILLVKGQLVPIGRDQASHVELARELARSFNAVFAPVFPVPAELIPDGGVLPGTDGRTKMSRSLGNAINLSDDAATVTAKVMAMYTDPARIHPTDRGHVEGNPVFAHLDAFNADRDEVEELKARYRVGRIGDVAVKRRLAEVLNEFLDPIRDRRDALLRQSPSLVNDVLQAGAARAREEARLTIHEVRAAMNLGSFDG